MFVTFQYFFNILGAIAVGRDVFRADANTLVDLLMRIQSMFDTFISIDVCFTLNFLDSAPDPDDTLLGHYMIATWAKICQAMGPEFEPYLPVVMPPLLAAANAKADVSVYGMFYVFFLHYAWF
jgi:hypothetical protein